MEVQFGSGRRKAKGRIVMIHSNSETTVMRCGGKAVNIFIIVIVQQRGRISVIFMTDAGGK